METVNTIELKDENVYPDEKTLKVILGDSFSAYKQLLELYAKYGLLYTWRYYKDGKAWLCKVQCKTKTIAWMSAWKGYMKVVVYVPEKISEQVYNLNISEASISKIKSTKLVGKSRPCIFEIRGAEIINDVEQTVQFKLNS